MENDSWKNSKQNWYLLRFSQMSVKRMREKLEATGLEFFLPSYTVVENRRKTMIRVERALMFNMLFVRSTLSRCVEFVVANPNVNFMVKHSEDHPSVSLNQLKSDVDDGFAYDEATFRYVIVIPERQMEMFIKAVQVRESGLVPYMKPTEVDLEKGDKVRIVGGAYDGIEGILESQQGKDGGTVFVHLQNFLATRTTEIRPEFIKIIEFAKGGKHMYKKFDSFMTRGHRCVLAHINNENITPRDISYLNVFTRRFCDLHTPTVNMTAKLRLFMFIAYTCLGDAENAENFRSLLVDYLPEIKSEPMLFKCNLYLYALTADNQFRKNLVEITKPWRRQTDLDSKKQEAKKMFQDIDWLLANT